MKDLIQKIDPELSRLLGCLNGITENDKIAAEFGSIKSKFPQYDTTALWLICYTDDYSINIQKYIEANYNKFHQYLDSGFSEKILSKDRFDSNVWEMVLCDILSGHGELQQKSKDGADFILKTGNDQTIQVEAIVPNEADDESLRAHRPDLSAGNVVSTTGKIADLENPILLRAVAAFDDKAKMEYDRNNPLIIAINTSKAVGLISNDDYVIRRVLLGLGNVTLTRNSDGSYRTGLENIDVMNKPGQPEFIAARFRDENYRHVSGVIYTSQKPYALVPGGFGWSNQGVTYVPNPLATHKVNLDFKAFNKIMCDEEAYREVKAEKSFSSNC